MASVKWNRGAYEVRWRESGRNAAKRFNAKKLGGKTTAKKMADRYALDVEQRIATGQTVLRRQDVPNLETFATDWLASRRGHISERTFDDYGHVLDRHITPYLGHLLLVDIRPRTIYDWQQDRLAAGAGARQIKLARGVLQQIMSWAVILEWVESNPVREIRPPKQTRQTTRALDPEEVETIRKHFLDQSDPRSALIVSIIAYGGLRSYSEVFALQRADIGKETIQVRRGVTCHTGPDGSLIAHIHDHPKTGWRTIRPPAALMAELNDWLNSRPGRLVFPNHQGHPWTLTTYNNWKRRSFDSACDHTGIPRLRLYDLRHTCASLRLKAGASIPEVAEYLGNSVEICSRYYLHIVESLEGRHARSVDALIRQARKTVGS